MGDIKIGEWIGQIQNSYQAIVVIVVVFFSSALIVLKRRKIKNYFLILIPLLTIGILAMFFITAVPNQKKQAVQSEHSNQSDSSILSAKDSAVVQSIKQTNNIKINIGGNVNNSNIYGQHINNK